MLQQPLRVRGVCARWCVAVIPALLLLACPKSSPAVADAAVDVEDPSPKDLARMEKDVADDVVTPVYPKDNAPPLPEAVQLCRALQARPLERKVECCGSGSVIPVITEECVRVTTAALRSGSTVLDGAKAAACIQAVEASLQGCNWLSYEFPPVPHACQHLFRGTLKEGARCRSALECQDAMVCRGLSPTNAGVCSVQSPKNTLCGTITDPLATYTRQDHVEADKGVCAGRCSNHLCQDVVPLGGKCSDVVDCGRDAHCGGGVCKAGPFAAAGQPCLPGNCEGALHCVAGVCAPGRPKGAACKASEDCEGACIQGVCGTTCGYVPGGK